MKRKAPLVLSLLLNAILAGAVCRLAFRPAQRPPPPKPEPETVQAGVEPAQTIGSPAAERPRRSARDGWPVWLPQFRAAGAPESLLAELAATDFQSRWEKRCADLLAQCQRGELDPITYANFVGQHDVDQEKELRAALGDDAFRRWDQEQLLREFSNPALELSPAEQDSLYGLKKNLMQQRRELQQAHRDGEIGTDNCQDRQTALETQYREQLQTLLGTDRFATLQDAGGLQAGLRRRLKILRATDAQISAVLEVQNQWTWQQAELQRDSPPAGDYDGQMQALNGARDAEFERVLGPDDFAEFQKNQTAGISR